MGVSATAPARLRISASPQERTQLVERARKRVSRAMIVANVVGAFDVFALLFFVLPGPDGVEPQDNLTANLAGFAIYLPLGLWLGHHFGNKLSALQSAWLKEGREPDAVERDRVLSAPLHCAKLAAGIWLGAAVLFGAINLSNGVADGLHVACTILMGGLTTCAVGYLLVERIDRPLTSLVLAVGPPTTPRRPGVEGRLV